MRSFTSQYGVLRDDTGVKQMATNYNFSEQHCGLVGLKKMCAAGTRRTTPMRRVLPSTLRLILSLDCPGMSALICA